MARSAPPKILIVGLGNPGPEYEETRHNVGAMAVARLVSLLKLKLARDRSSGGWSARRGRVALARPGSFMNESGPAVARLAAKFGDPSPLIVNDDLDLPLGTIRFRTRGSAGGHHGLESIIAALGTDRFPRLKIGIGKPESRENTVDYVLSPFPEGEWKLLSSTLDRAAEALRDVINDGMEHAMSRHSK